MTLPNRPLGDAIRPASNPVTVTPGHEYRITGIYSFGRGLIKRPTIDGSETAYSTLTRLRSGQLVMSKLNAWEGALSVVSDEFCGTYVSPEYPIFEIDKDVADPSYIAHLVRWSTLWERLTPRGSMVRRKRTNPSTLLETLAPLPELKEQQRIASCLGTASTKIARIRAAHTKTERLRASIFNSIISSTGETHALSEFLIPSSDYTNVTYREDYRTAGIYSHGRGLFSRPIIAGSETTYKKYNRLHEGEFVYSKLFGWEGALAVVCAEFNGYYVSHEFPTFKIDESRADRGYVTHLTKWPGLHAQLKDKATGMGSRRQRVNPERLLSATVPLPDLREQQRTANLLDKLQTKKEIAISQGALVVALNQSLLDAAFSGRL